MAFGRRLVGAGGAAVGWLMAGLALGGCQGGSAERLAFEGEPASDAEIRRAYGLSADDLRRLHEDADLTSAMMMELPEQIVAKTLRNLTQAKDASPDKAMEWRIRQRLNEKGEIPEDALMIAKAQRDRLVSPARGMAISAWEWLGPGNIGGRTRAVVIDHANPSVMYAGGVSGGVWKTLNGGASWAPLNDFLASIQIGSLAMDPNDSQTIWIGTGEGVIGGSPRGDGVFVSNDGGATFSQLSSTTGNAFDYVNRIVFAPGSSTTAMVATNSGLFLTEDAGNTMQQMLSLRIFDVEYDPTDAMKVVCSASNQVRTSVDGGATWQTATGISPGGGRVEIAIAPSNSSIVYASVANSGLYRSDDGGATFAQTSATNYMAHPGSPSQGWWDNAIWVDPTDADTVVVGGIDLWRSRDGGATLTRISQWQFAPSSAHADNHWIIHHPDYDGVTNRTVYFGNDGGVYMTSDVYNVSTFLLWQELNNNYGVTQFYSGAGNATDRVLGGTQDNGTLVFDGDSESWFTMVGGDGTYVAADSELTNYFYGAWQYGNMVRSQNEGQSWVYIADGVTDVAAQTSNFVPPFILDPNNQARLIFGGDSLWRTNNARGVPVDWDIIKPSIGPNVSAIAIAPGDADLMYVAHTDGSIYKSVDATSPAPTWERLDDGTFLPNRWATRLAIDPGNHNHVYVTFSGFSLGNVWKTEDGGTSWASVSGMGAGALPACPMNSIVLDPDIAGRLFVGSDLGVLFSDNDGQTWGTNNLGPANTIVDELFLWNTSDNGTWLVAATHGRGMFRTVIRAPCPADLNGDGLVGATDFAIALGSWGFFEGSSADLNGDGLVASADLAIMLGSWGVCP